MSDVELTHNPSNGVTRGVWRRGDVVHKVLTRRKEAPAHWAASDDPRHWNYWKREALVYTTGLPERLGLGAPRLLGWEEKPDGDLELRLEHVDGAHGGALAQDGLRAAARALGRAQGTPPPDEPWFSRGFLRDYVGSRAVDWSLIDDDAAWAQPLVRRHFPPPLRDALRRLHANRERLLALLARLPRLGIRASAVKYDWLTAFCLEHASEEQPAYGRQGTVDPDARYAARAAGLRLCARWAEEALRA